MATTQTQQIVTPVTCIETPCCLTVSNAWHLFGCSDLRVVGARSPRAGRFAGLR